MVASQSPVCQSCAMPMTKPGDSALILMALNTMSTAPTVCRKASSPHPTRPSRIWQIPTLT